MKQDCKRDFNIFLQLQKKFEKEKQKIHTFNLKDKEIIKGT